MLFFTFSIKNVIKNKWSSNRQKFKNTQLQFKNPGSYKKNKVYELNASISCSFNPLRTDAVAFWWELGLLSLWEPGIAFVCDEEEAPSSWYGPARDEETASSCEYVWDEEALSISEKEKRVVFDM